MYLKLFRLILIIHLLAFSFNAFSEPVQFRCQLKEGAPVYTDPQKTNVFRTIPANANPFCKKLNTQTVIILGKIDQDKEKFYVDISALTNVSRIQITGTDTPITPSDSLPSPKLGFRREIKITDLSQVETEPVSSEELEDIEAHIGDEGEGDGEDENEGEDPYKPVVAVRPEFVSGLKTEAKEVTSNTTRALKDAGWIPVIDLECPSGMRRRECRNAQELVRTIDNNVLLSLTGERRIEPENGKYYAEVIFDHGGKQFKGWVQESKTELDPSEMLALKEQNEAREQTSKKFQSWLNGGPNPLGFDSEIGYSSENTTAYALPMDQDSQTQRAKASQETRAYYADESRVLEEKERQALAEFITNNDNRKLIKLHPERRGLCGGWHYSREDEAYKEPGADSYANPLTACVLSRLEETWKKQFCPSGGVCRLEFGDISHATLKYFDTHQSHTHGNCIDIRPIKKSGVGRVTPDDTHYDQDKTKALLKLIKNLGGTNVRFNDKDMIKAGLARRLKNHDSHIHFCFNPDNKDVQNSCAGYSPDERICPRADLLFNHPWMKDMKEGLGN